MAVLRQFFRWGLLAIILGSGLLGRPGLPLLLASALSFPSLPSLPLLPLLPSLGSAGELWVVEAERVSPQAQVLAREQKYQPVLRLTEIAKITQSQNQPLSTQIISTQTRQTTQTLQTLQTPQIIERPWLLAQRQQGGGGERAAQQSLSQSSQSLQPLQPLEREIATLRLQMESHEWDTALARVRLLLAQPSYQNELVLKEILFEITLALGLIHESEVVLTSIERERPDAQTAILRAKFHLAQSGAPASSMRSLLASLPIYEAVPGENVDAQAALTPTSTVSLSSREHAMQAIFWGRSALLLDRRQAEVHLLLCEANLRIGELRQAEQHKREYVGLRGQDAASLACEINLLLAADPPSEGDLLARLQAHRQKTRRDPDVFLIEAKVYQALSKPREAFRAVEQALTLHPNRKDALQFKLALLYAEEDYAGLRVFLTSSEGEKAGLPPAAHLYLRALSYFLEYQLAQPTASYDDWVAQANWRLKDTAEPRRFLYAPLQELLQLEGGEKMSPQQFFYEALLMANTPFTSALRVEAARGHLQRGERYLRLGDNEASRMAFLRALSLAPQERSFREAYLPLLRREGAFRSYGEALTIIETLRAPDEEGDYVRSTQAELVARRLSGDLEETYALSRDEISRAGSTWIAVLPARVEQTALTVAGISPALSPSAAGSSGGGEGSFYMERLMTGMLREALETSSIFQVRMVRENERPAQFLSPGMIFDGFLRMSFRDDGLRLTLNYVIEAPRSREPLVMRSVITTGVARYEEGFLQLRQEIEARLPRRGRVLRVEGSSLLLSLGKRTLTPALGVVGGAVSSDPVVTENAPPQFYVHLSPRQGFETTSQQRLGPFPIVRVEERVSLGEVTDPFALRQISVGAGVSLAPIIVGNTTPP